MAGRRYQRAASDTDVLTRPAADGTDCLLTSMSPSPTGPSTVVERSVLIRSLVTEHAGTNVQQREDAQVVSRESGFCPGALPK